jgi:hypothetical protein
VTIAMSPVEQVLAQLGRQKWAVDTRDAAALKSLYTADSAQVIYQAGPDGRTEIARSRGRDEIIGAITAGWARTAATWYPGAMIHQIGSVVPDPAAGGRIRCRSYASFLALDARLPRDGHVRAPAEPRLTGTRVLAGPGCMAEPTPNGRRYR